MLIEGFVKSLVWSLGIAMSIALILIPSEFTKCIDIIKNRYDKIKRKMAVDMITATIIIATTIWVIINLIDMGELKIFDKVDNDVSNWVTLIVEIGVGIIIAVIILIYSHSQDQNLEEQYF